MSLFSHKMIDDKGNPVPNMSVVIDTGKATMHNQPKPEYYLVIDRDTVYKLAGKPKPVTFDRLQETGYIKLWQKVRLIARETAHKKGSES